MTEQLMSAKRSYKAFCTNRLRVIACEMVSAVTVAAVVGSAVDIYSGVEEMVPSFDRGHGEGMGPDG